MTGLVRVALTALASSGLIYGASNLAVDADLSTPYDSAAPAARIVPVQEAALVCPGVESLGVSGAAAGRAPGARKPAPAQVVSATAPVQALPADQAGGKAGRLASGWLPASRAAAPSTSTRGAGVAVAASSAASPVFVAQGGLAAGLSAAQQTLVTSGAARGLTAAPCQPPASQTWLVGGGSQPGRREHVVLANRSANPVTVDVTVIGAAGPVSSPSGLGIVVPARGRNVLLLDGIAGQEAAPVVRVSARGGTVAATLHDTWLDGVVPRGGDATVGLVEPASELVVPGVSLSGAGAVRVAVPGDDEALVQVRLLTTDGPRGIGDEGVVAVPGQSVVDVPLTGLPAGSYAVQVRANRPVVAAALAERRAAGQGPSDFAWSPAAPPLRSLAGTPLAAAAGQTAQLHLASPGRTGTVTVTTVDPAGKVAQRAVSVAADSAAVVDLGTARAVWVTPVDGPVRAAVVTSVRRPDGVLLSALPLRDIPLTTVQPGLQQEP